MSTRTDISIRDGINFLPRIILLFMIWSSGAFIGPSDCPKFIRSVMDSLIVFYMEVLLSQRRSPPLEEEGY